MTRDSSRHSRESLHPVCNERGSCEIVVTKDLHAVAGVEVPFTGRSRGVLRAELRFEPEAKTGRVGTAKVRIFIQQEEDEPEPPKLDRFARKTPVAFSQPVSETPSPVDPPASPPARQAEVRRISIPWVILSGILLAAVGFGIGQATSSFHARDTREQMTNVPAERIFMDANQALSIVQSGNPAEGLRLLTELDQSNPDAPGLTYLVARTALEAGDLKLAESRIEAAIAESERVSDALALSAYLKGLSVPGDTGFLPSDASMKSILRQAVEADISNPYPLIDLANLLRSNGETAEARNFLEAARHRLPPIDAGPVVEASLKLLELESLPADSISFPLTRTPVDLLVNAYVAFRLGDIAKAEHFLEDCRQSTSPELYSYLVSDPIMKKWLPPPRLGQRSDP